MDGLSYDDVEKMLEARAEAAKRPKKRPGGRYLDVIRPGAEMKRAPKAPAMVLEETTVATVTLTPLAEELPEETTPEQIDQLVNGGSKTPENNADIDDLADGIDHLVIDEEVAEDAAQTDGAEVFLQESQNPFLPDAALRAEKRPLGREGRERQEASEPVADQAEELAAEPIKRSKRAQKALYAKDKVSQALTESVADRSLEREAEAALLDVPAAAKPRKSGNGGLLAFCIVLILIFGAIAGFLVYYLFLRR